MRSPPQIFRILLILLVLPLVGTFGFMTIEGWRFLDALYMSFITLSTIGYEVVHPLSDAGKIFVILYLGIGFSFFFYSLTQVGEMAMKGDLQRYFGGRMMERQIKGLEHHAILCGLGRMGRAIAHELSAKGEKFVIIDRDADRVEQARQEGWLCLKGDVSDDAILKQAGIERARCLATVLPHDADNLFCVMSARLLNKELTLITRASNESAVDKLKRAGATRIVSPYTTGAVKISQLMIHPEIEDFFEVFSDKNLDIDLTIVHVEKSSILYHKTLRELALMQRGVMVVGLRRKGQKLELPPPLDIALEERDILIAAGKSTQLATLFSREP